MTVGLHIVRAASRLDRLRGLIARSCPSPGQAFLIPDCASVHGFGMAYALDVVFVDREWRVVRVTSLRPFALRSCKLAWATLELRAGEAHRLGIVKSTQIEQLSTTDLRIRDFRA